MSALWAALWLAVPGWGAFGTSDRGTSAATFLALPSGARAAGMGEAYAAVADDAEALNWNPAALVRLERRSATFMHAAYVDSSRYDSAAYGQNLGRAGAVGVGARYLCAGTLARTDASGTDLGGFTPRDLAAAAGYARLLGGAAVGVAVKYVRSEIVNSAQTVAGDVGVLSPALFDGRLRLAATASNLGGRMRFETESEDLPAAARVGAALALRPGWTAALDAGLPRDDRPFAAAGTEFVLPEVAGWRAAVRAGFNSRRLGQVDGLGAAACGVGLGYASLRVDYGLTPLGGLGPVHRVSLTINF